MPRDPAARTPGEGPAPSSRAEGLTGPSPSVPPSPMPVPPGGEEERVESELQELVAGLERQAEARGRAALARDLLSVVDNLERALAAAEPRGDGNEGKSESKAANHIAEGIRLVYEELSGLLANPGVENYSPAGEQFDPDQHEAMLTRPGKQGEVVEVLQKGYRLNGQVLRPARVVVGAGEE